ncbi:MAG: S8 family serine peptidase [Gemmatimonadetes bacterium]|nr:S8 family serine peptidase [Gemmatimonadota bacterium]
MRTLGVHCAVFGVEAGTSVDAVITALDADQRIESVQRMQQFEVRQSAAPPIWDDPYHTLQRSLEDAGITEAHRWSTGRGVRIAIIDTGVDARHPDLRGQVTDIRNFGPGGAITPDRHGTAVAGIIASIAGNRRGIVGVAPGARLLALQACAQQSPDGRGRCTSFSLARALDYAIESGSDVLNLSLGGPPDRLLERLLIKAIERNIVVVAARAEGRPDASFPATLEGVIAVVDDRTPAEAAWLRAPSHDVLTLVPPDGYDYLSGSSIAAAHVSGIVALLRERAPALRGPEIRDLLAHTSRSGREGGAGSRSLVSACDALAALSNTIRCGVAPVQTAQTIAGREPLEAR